MSLAAMLRSQALGGERVDIYTSISWRSAQLVWSDRRVATLSADLSSLDFKEGWYDETKYNIFRRSSWKRRCEVSLRATSARAKRSRPSVFDTPSREQGRGTFMMGTLNVQRKSLDSLAEIVNSLDDITEW